ncbi:MAG TPA: GAF domain-containing sensor histidine kinase [Thermoanaerobaculia bacterium]|nr:GAF domain-containing sensor histidine kinase [Thermoanaerobaculia bacterium]
MSAVLTAEAEYALADKLVMTLRKLRVVAMIVPIAAVLVLEVVRYFVIGPVPIGKRLLMDVVSIAGILVFTTIIFRFIDEMQTRLRRQNEELLALHDAGLAISAELALDAVLKKVVDQARTLVGAKYGAVSVVDRSDRIEQFITSGIDPHQRSAIGPPPVGHGVLGVVLREGRHLRLDDVRLHPQSSGFPPNHPVMRSLLAVPIDCKGPFRGNIYLSEKNDGASFTEHDHETLVRFSVQAGIAIDNAFLHAQAADLAVAEERLRIAHEMHDGLAQVLGYVNTKVQAADAYLRRGKTEDASGQLRELAVSARQAYSEVREGIVGLRTLPGPDRPLDEVLREYLERWREQSGISTDLTIQGELRLRPSIELQLVRIIQEALANVRKHAKATHVRVDVARRNGTLTTSIIDNGLGFDPDARHRTEFPRFGLSTMRERAESIGGSLIIDSAAGKGTTIRFELPEV